LRIEPVDRVEGDREQLHHRLDAVGVGQRPVHPARFEAVRPHVEGQQQAVVGDSEPHLLDVVALVDRREGAADIGAEQPARRLLAVGVDNIGAIECRVADRHFAPARTRRPLADIATPHAGGVLARRRMRQAQQQAAEHGDVLVALAALAALRQVRLDHAELDALDLAFDAVLEVAVVVHRQHAQLGEIRGIGEIGLGAVAEAEEARQLLHDEGLHVRLQLGDRDVADGDHDDPEDDDDEDPKSAPVASQHGDQPHGQRGEAAADDEPAQQARLAAAALLRLEPRLDLLLVERAEGQEFRPRRRFCIGFCRHDRDSHPLRFDAIDSTAAG
jgi:hypothetical protein